MMLYVIYVMLLAFPYPTIPFSFLASPVLFNIISYFLLLC